jgi:hypothetical protein
LRSSRIVAHPEAISDDLREAFEAKGDFEKAEQLYYRILGTRDRVLGADHPNTLTSINHLAALLRKAGRDEQALALDLRRAFSLRINAKI